MWLGVAAVAGVLFCAGATWSEPARNETACSECNRRVAALEVRVERLEKQVTALEARVGTASATTNGAKNTPQPVPESNNGNVKSFPPVGGCSPPYTVDGSGIQQPKAGCDDVPEAPCDPPYVIDAQGVRHPKAACLR